MAQSKHDRLKSHVARVYEAKGIASERVDAWASRWSPAPEEPQPKPKEEPDGGTEG